MCAQYFIVAPQRERARDRVRGRVREIGRVMGSVNNDVYYLFIDIVNTRIIVHLLNELR